MIKVFLVESSAVVRSIEKKIIQMTSNLELVGETANLKDLLDSGKKIADFIFIEASKKNVNDVERVLLQKKKNIGNIILLTTEKIELLGNYNDIIIWTIPDLVSCSSKKLCEMAKNLENNITELKAKALLNRKKIESKKNDKKNLLQKKHLLKKEKNIDHDFKIVLVGVSTGGPGAILKLLNSIGRNFPLPILITQHIDSSFEKNLTNWLQNSLPMPIHVAEDGIKPLPGNVYFAPADVHMVVSKDKEGEIIIKLNHEPPVNFLRPSVDKLFMSGAEVIGSNVISVLLTGMGADGASGSCVLKEKGAYTIAESQETCVIYGMPKAAIDMGGIVESIPLYDIGKKLWLLAGRES